MSRKVERGLFVAVATLTDGVWSLAVQHVRGSGTVPVVEVPEAAELRPVSAAFGWLDLDNALIEVGFHRITGWSSEPSGTSFKTNVRRFPVVAVPGWADQRFDVTPCQSLEGDVSVTFEKTFGNTGHDFVSECSVWLSQTFRLVDGDLEAGPAVVHVHTEAPDLDVVKALEVASWLTAAGALAGQINEGLPAQTGRAA